MDASLSMNMLTRRLRRAYLRAHRRDRNTVLGFLISQTLLAFFLVYVLDRLTGFPAPVRLLLTLGVLGGVLGWRLYRNSHVLRSRHDPEGMAREVERRARDARPGGLHSLLVSATEFGVLGRAPGSAELRRRVLVQAGESENDPTRLVLHRLEDAQRTRKWVLAAVAVYALWALISPASMGVFFARAAGWPAMYPTRTGIESVEAPTAVARFEDVSFQVTGSGQLPAQGMLEISYPGGNGFDIPLNPTEDAPEVYVGILERPQSDFTYRVRLGDAHTRKASVRVVAPPMTGAGTLTVHPPPYTERSPRTQPLGGFDMWQGGRFDLETTVTGEVGSAELILGDAALPMERIEGGFRITDVSPDETTPFSVRLVGEGGVENRRRPEFTLSVREDNPPQVELRSPDEGGNLAPRSLLRWRFRATDDLGMETAVLKATLIRPEVLGDEGEVLEESKTLETIELNLAELEGARELELDGSLVADTLGAMPGTRLELRIGVRDRYPDRDPDEGWSDPVTLRVVTGPELKKILAEELMGAHLMIQDIRDDMKRQRTAVQIRNDMQSEIGGQP